MTQWRASVAVWLAVQSRRFAQWLDPLPAEDSAQLAFIQGLREAIGDSQRETVTAAQAHHVAMEDARALRAQIAALEVKYAHAVPVPHDDVYFRAVSMTEQWKDREVIGEFKRHQVLASLIDEFPDRGHRSLALAIEAALWR